jgi:hypothetical protein
MNPRHLKLAWPLLLGLWLPPASADSVFSLARVTIAYPDLVPNDATVVDSAYGDHSASGQLVLRPDGSYTQTITICRPVCVTGQGDGRIVGGREGKTFTVQDAATGALYQYSLIATNPVVILAVNSNSITEITQWVLDGANAVAATQAATLTADAAPPGGIVPTLLAQDLVPYLEPAP